MDVQILTECPRQISGVHRTSLFRHDMDVHYGRPFGVLKLSEKDNPRWTINLINLIKMIQKVGHARIKTIEF